MRKIILLLGITLACSTAAHAWVTHHNPVFQPDIPKPAVGIPYNDPRFGPVVMRLTDARSSSLPGVVPQYAKRQVWNANDSLMLLFTGDGTALLYDAQSYQFIRTLDVVGGEDVFWHPFDPLRIILAQDNALVSYHVDTGLLETLRVFPAYTFINTRGEGNLSRDGRYYAFVGQTYDTITHFNDIVVYDITANQVIATLALPAQLTDFDWVSISPLGNYVVVDYATGDTGRFQGVEVYDRNLTFLWQKPLGAGHSDLAVAPGTLPIFAPKTGGVPTLQEVLVMDYYDSDSNRNYIRKYRLADGAETTLLDYSWDFDCHISCRNEARSEWCFVSTFDGPGRLSDDSLSWLPYEDEIFALKLDGSGDVQRIAHHHSRRFSPETPDPDLSVYWAEPHATVSKNGERIVFGSNWRQQMAQDTSVDAYLVDMRNMIGIHEEKPVEPGLRRTGSRLQAIPNPFTAQTTIRCELPISGPVRLTIRDAAGRVVKTLSSYASPLAPNEFRWDAKDEQGRGVAAGVYFYCLEAGGYAARGRYRFSPRKLVVSPF
jgi:hypothetical protein